MILFNGSCYCSILLAIVIIVGNIILVFDKHIFMSQSDGDQHQIGPCHAIVLYSTYFNIIKAWEGRYDLLNGYYNRL